MNRRKFLGFLAVAPAAPLLAASVESHSGWINGAASYRVGKRGPEINLSNNVDARGATEELIQRLPEILEQNNRRMLELIKDQHSRGALI